MYIVLLYSNAFREPTGAVFITHRTLAQYIFGIFNLRIEITDTPRE